MEGSLAAQAYCVGRFHQYVDESNNYCELRQVKDALKEIANVFAAKLNELQSNTQLEEQDPVKTRALYDRAFEQINGTEELRKICEPFHMEKWKRRQQIHAGAPGTPRTPSSLKNDRSPVETSRQIEKETLNEYEEKKNKLETRYIIALAFITLIAIIALAGFGASLCYWCPRSCCP